MVVYIIVAVAVVAFLAVAYRTLGGATADGVENEQVVRQAADELRHAATRLAAFAGEAVDLSSGAASGIRPVRGQVESAAQLLEQVDGAVLSSTEADARALLRTAAVELLWAARLQETGPTVEAEGVRDAVTALLHHGGRCIESAQGMLRVSAEGPEGLHGAAESVFERH